MDNVINDSFFRRYAALFVGEAYRRLLSAACFTICISFMENKFEGKIMHFIYDFSNHVYQKNEKT